MVGLDIPAEVAGAVDCVCDCVCVGVLAEPLLLLPFALSPGFPLLVA